MFLGAAAAESGDGRDVKMTMSLSERAIERDDGTASAGSGVDSEVVGVECDAEFA